MAIIKCPECGQDVSDKAKVCIHCGAPISIDKEVKIKLLPIKAQPWMIKPCQTFIKANGKTIWEGTSHQIVIIKIDEPTNVEITLLKGTNDIVIVKNIVFTATIEPGSNYEMRNKNGLRLMGSKVEWCLSKVDVIDSTD